jgi:hypothetical protein
VIANWRRWLPYLLVVLVVLFGITYAGDWAVFRYRVSKGTAFGSVEVDQFLATPLKGQKTEYDLVGSGQQTCSRSIFPQQGNSACWWLKRHSSQWE